RGIRRLWRRHGAHRARGGRRARVPQRALLPPTARTPLHPAALAHARRARRDSHGAWRREVQLHARGHPSTLWDADPPGGRIPRGRPMTSSILWTLIVIQIALGAFDVIYHHEMTERLAWRRSQQRELVLHAIRNLLYGVLFVLLGWFEVHGIWA